MIERPSRRPALAIYVANVATETMFRIFIARGYFTPINRGEILLFTVTMSILLYLVKKNGFGNDPVSLALKFIIGREEALKRHKSLNQESLSLIENRYLSIPNLLKPYSKSFLSNFLVSFIKKFNSLFPKHNSCPHEEKSCLTYVSIAFLRSLLFGWLGKTALQTFSKPKMLLIRPSIVKRNLLNPNNVSFGLFLGAFTAVYKGVNCFLRWASNESHDWHAFIAAIFAGPTMFLSPNTPITLYLMWKCIEVLVDN
jgi:hypothetical protein